MSQNSSLLRSYSTVWSMSLITAFCILQSARAFTVLDSRRGGIPVLVGIPQMNTRLHTRLQSSPMPSTRSMDKVKSPSNYYTEFFKENVLVGIESTSSNSRRISGEIHMDLPWQDVWGILTDYDNLSTHVPNLVASKVINRQAVSLGDNPRVYQRGSQKIFGFSFGADVTMDMRESAVRDSKIHCIDFRCVDSQFFSQFDGSWIVQECSNSRTMVRYIVDVRPKGPVPVAALEWRIKDMCLLT